MTVEEVKERSDVGKREVAARGETAPARDTEEVLHTNDRATSALYMGPVRQAVPAVVGAVPVHRRL